MADEDDPADQASADEVDERAELERLRDVHREEQRARRVATVNYRDAETYRNMIKPLGIDPDAVTNMTPEEILSTLHDTVRTAQIERIREEVARTERVDPDILTATTEDEMRTQAKRFNARVESEIAARAPVIAPAAAPAAEVTANGKIEGGLGQIRSRDELRRMDPGEIKQAHQDGLLDDIIYGRY